MKNRDDDFEYSPHDEEELDLDFLSDDSEEEEELIPEPEETKEEVTKEEKPYIAVPELDLLRQEKDKLELEREQLLREREEAFREADEAKAQVIKHAITSMQSQLDHETDMLTKLHQNLESAKIDGDKERVEDLIAKISAQSKSIHKLQGEITNANYQLNQRTARAPENKPVERKESAPTEAQKFASQWAKENGWYNDPEYVEKKRMADDIYQSAVREGYNPGTLKFWTYLDKKLNEAPSQRRTPPAVRPIGGNNNRMDKKAKADKEILDYTNKIMELRGASAAVLGDEEYKRKKLAVYRSVERQLKNAKKTGE